MSSQASGPGALPPGPAFTPGPWIAAAKPSSIVGWPVVAPHAMGRSICNVTTGHDEGAANARLIAATPELHAVATRAHDFVDDLMDRCIESLKSDPLYGGDPYDAPDDCECDVTLSVGEIRKLRALADEALTKAKATGGANG